MSTSETQITVIGPMRQEFIITHDGKTHLGMPGGSAIYAASGARMWNPSVSILARVDASFPDELILSLADHGIDVANVRRLDEDLETRIFFAYLSPEERYASNPTEHFLKVGQTLPKELINYRPAFEQTVNSATYLPLSIRPSDIPQSISPLEMVHLTPEEFSSQSSLPVRLRDLGATIVSLDASDAYMIPGHVQELQTIINGLDIFFVGEEQARSFFRPEPIEVNEMAEAFAAMGCARVVIKRGPLGQHLYEHPSGRHWRVPSYPVDIKDITCVGDTYCGGFMAGYLQTGDMIEAALQGGASASLSLEGAGALYPLDALPGLARARAEALRDSISLQ